MRTPSSPACFGQALISIASLGSLGAVRAEEAAVGAEFGTPESSVSAGIGVTSGDERDRARFAKARSYMLRKDDLMACKNIRCRKRFEIPSAQSIVFI